MIPFARRQTVFSPPSPPPPPPPRPPKTPPPPIPLPKVTDLDWAQVIGGGQEKVPLNKQELIRILSLPVLPADQPRCPDPEAYDRGMLLPHSMHPEFHLRPIQIDAIWTFETFGGLFGPQSVGSGKTIITIASAIRAITGRGHYRACIMVPPQVLEQLVERDIPWARERIDFQGVPFHVCAGTWQMRKDVSRRPGTGVWIYTYSSLSTKTGYEELKNIRATCYIMDEAHNLARATTTRTKRWHTALRELEEAGVIRWTQQMTGTSKVNAIECLAVSGTLTKKSIRDYGHLATRAMGTLSPVPTHQATMEVFSSILDAGVNCAVSEVDLHNIQFLQAWAQANGFDLDCIPRREDETDEEYEFRKRVGLTLQERLRMAFQYRLHSAPCVVATTEQGVDSSLLIRWIEPKRDANGVEEMTRLMQRVVVEKLTPGGDEIDFGMHQFKWLWELSAGFYNHLQWPDEQKIISDHLTKHGEAISAAQAGQLLRQAQKAHGTLQSYHKRLRQWFEAEHIPGCDSPMLVGAEITRQLDDKKIRYPLPQDLIQLYHRHREDGPYTYPKLPERFSVPVSVSDYKIKAAVAWAKEHGEGIIWYHHPFIGDWICRALAEAGVPHTHAAAGRNREAFAEGIVVASYSHGTGKNLQHQFKNLFVELRREAYLMEQTIGRTHRSGQESDEVEVYLLLGNGFDLAMFNGILRDADYAQGTLGQKQRLCYATYNPVIPAINPRLMLRLGIIRNIAGAVNPDSWSPITPDELREVADLLRPQIYGQKGGKNPN